VSEERRVKKSTLAMIQVHVDQWKTPRGTGPTKGKPASLAAVLIPSGHFTGLRFLLLFLSFLFRDLICFKKLIFCECLPHPHLCPYFTSKHQPRALFSSSMCTLAGTKNIYGKCEPR
jgi:hypothetical protein